MNEITNNDELDKIVDELIARSKIEGQESINMSKETSTKYCFLVNRLNKIIHSRKKEAIFLLKEIVILLRKDSYSDYHIVFRLLSNHRDSLFNSIKDMVIDVVINTNPDEYKQSQHNYSEVRFAKYEAMIENINNEIKKEPEADNIVTLRNVGALESNLALSLIFDYHSCNKYAKTIIDGSELLINSERNKQWDVWREKYPNRISLIEIKDKIEASKLFVQYCKEPCNRTEKYKFIFWALMILTVDKNNVEEYLSLICDFVKMLGITNEEFEDIIYVIRCIYNEADMEHEFKSKSVPAVFENVLNLYEI